MQLMSIDNIKDIRQTILLAKAYEKKSGEFDRLMLQHAHYLPNSIALDNAHSTVEASHALEELAIRYIEHVPDFLEAIYQIAEQAGIDREIEPFLQIAEDYFLKPPEVVDGHMGLDALMDESYLAHRLMEELNDRFISHCGIPLAPLDMTRANIIIHHLIGEPFANELDLIVQHAAENLIHNARVFDTEHFQRYAQDHHARGWSEELKRWPCLMQDLNVELKIGDSKNTADADSHDTPKTSTDFIVH